MGEAKRRGKEIDEMKKQAAMWRESLSLDERTILQLAERLDERLIRGLKFSEGCYHLAFFMTKYLANHGITVTPTIGWVNDGTWQGMTSHGWIEYKGKKTDISLGCTSNPDAQPIGSMIVLDRVLRKGTADYTYYENDAPKVAVGLKYMRSNPDLDDVLAHKEAEHATMIEIAGGGPKAIDDYLFRAPQGLKYDDLVRIVD